MKEIILRTEADLAAASSSALLGVTFAKSSSSSYPLAVEIAKTALRYSEKDCGGKPVHFVLFGRSREEAIKARTVLRYVGNWKSCQIYAGGMGLQNWYRIEMVLECYLASTAAPDPKTHCNVVLPEVMNRFWGLVGGPFLFPCRYMANWTGHDLDPRLPATAPEQLQAAAVRRGCDWCPNFHPEDFRKI